MRRVRFRYHGGGVAGATPLSRNEHPRLILTTDNLTAVQTRCADVGATGWNTEYQYLWTYHGLGLMTAAPTGIAADFQNGMVLAFLYATYSTSIITYDGYTQAQIGARAALYITSTSTSFGLDGYFQRNHLNFAADWCWNVMNGTDRAHVADLMAYNNGQGTGVDPTSGVNMAWASFQPYNSQYGVAAASRFMGALALSGAGYYDSWATSVIAGWDGVADFGGEYFRGDHATTRFYSTVLETTSIKSENGVLEGKAYDEGYNLPLILLAEESYRRATLPTGSNDLTSRTSWYATMDTLWWQKMPYREARTIIPYSNGGTDYKVFRQPYLSAQALQLAGFSGDRSNLMMIQSMLTGIDDTCCQLAEWLQVSRYGGRDSPTGALYYWYYPFALIMGIKGTTSRTPDDVSMALSHYTGRRVLCRADWTTETSYFYGMFMARYGGAANHDDTGWNGHLFAEFNKVPVLINRGSGNAAQNFGAPGSRNDVCFPDRNVDSAADNNGGKRVNFDPRTSSTITVGSQYDFIGSNGVRARLRSGSRDCDYMMADFTASYDHSAWADSGNSTRVRYYERHAAWFPGATNTDPLRAVVFDRWTLADNRFWATQCWNMPGVSTNIAVAGHASSYAGGPCNTANHPKRNGSVVNHETFVRAATADWTTTLRGQTIDARLSFVHPSSVTVTLAGGPNAISGGDIVNPGGDSSKSRELVDLYGGVDKTVEVGISTGSEIHAYYGKYHLQAVPSDLVAGTASSIGYMVTVLQVGTSGYTKETVEAIAATTDFVGGRVGTRIAVFGKDGITKSTGSFVIPSSGTYNIGIFGLTPSLSRSFTGTGGIASIVGIDPVVASGNPITATTSTAGSVYLTVVASSAATGTITINP